MIRSLVFSISLGLASVGFSDFVLADLNTGLAAYYKLDGDAGDSSGNGNDGNTYNDDKWVNGKIGQSAAFDGVDDYIDVSKIAAQLAGHGTGTISLWFNWPESSDQNGELLHYADNSGTTGGSISLGNCTDYFGRLRSETFSPLPSLPTQGQRIKSSG